MAVRVLIKDLLNSKNHDYLTNIEIVVLGDKSS